MSEILFEFYTSFKETRGHTYSAIGLILSALVFYIDPKGSVSWKWLVAAGIIITIFLIALTDFAIRSYKGAVAKLPRVKAAKQPHSLYKDAIALLLLEKSVLYGQESLVSIYYRDDDFELLVGIGWVITIQSNGLIQVLVVESTTSEDIWKSVQQNNAAVLDRILVKPTVPKQFKP